MNRDYNFAPDGMEVLHVDTREKFKFDLKYVKKPRIKAEGASYKAQDYEEKGLKAGGVRIDTHEVESIVVESADAQANLFS
jgi:topoisomerase-4 subunit A